VPDNNFRHRSVRIQGYDYSQSGAYFVTICTWQKNLIFGEITKGIIHLSKLGEIARQELERLPHKFSVIQMDTFVVMPNHIHMLITISGNDAAIQTANSEAFRHPLAGSIPTIVRTYKASVTRRVVLLRDIPVSEVWQRNYYEHVVRNAKEHERIYAYIVANPVQWDSDDENPADRSRV
jgi:REP element-mobilizing transposase RayT